jgi:hypothetical protein
MLHKDYERKSLAGKKIVVRLKRLGAKTNCLGRNRQL